MFTLYAKFRYPRTNNVDGFMRFSDFFLGTPPPKSYPFAKRQLYLSSTFIAHLRYIYKDNNTIRKTISCKPVLVESEY